MKLQKIKYIDYKVTAQVNRCDIGKNIISLSVTDEDMFLILILNNNGDFLVDTSFSFNTALDTYYSTIETLQALILT